MKKLSLILILATAVMFGCGAEGNKGATSAASSTAKTGGEDKPTVDAGKPIHLDAASFKQLVMDYESNPREWIYEGDKPSIIDFYADWCKPCRIIAPIMEELAAEYKGKINIYKIDTEAHRDLAAVFGIQSLPTVLFVPMQGKPSAQMGAMDKAAYKQIIDDFLLKPQSTQTN